MCRHELHRFSNDSVVAVSDYVDEESAVELIVQEGSGYQVCVRMYVCNSLMQPDCISVSPHICRLSPSGRLPFG